MQSLKDNDAQLAGAREPAERLRLLQDRGYADVSHVVEFFGICPKCQSVAPARNATPAIPSDRV